MSDMYFTFYCSILPSISLFYTNKSESTCMCLRSYALLTSHVLVGIRNSNLTLTRHTDLHISDQEVAQ